MEESSFFWISAFSGRLHPLIVHFPIGLIVAAFFLELLTINGKRPGLREGVNWLVYLGTLSAFVAAILGLLLYQVDDYQGSLVENHLIFGALTTVLGVLTVWQLRRLQKNGYQNFIYYRALLTLTVVSLAVAGHLGGSLTHGEDFLSSTLPWNNDGYDEGKASELMAELAVASQNASLSPDQQDRLNLEVRAIFAHNCYQCHSELKQKGELVLETEEGVMKGGESGKILIKGDAKNSEIIRRLELPRDHEESMPGKGKALSKEEIKLISLWIDEGAHWADESLKVFPEAELALSKPKLPAGTDKKAHPVDRLMTAYFEEKGQEMPQVVDDNTFIRRAYLDVIGLLPTPEQIEAFEQNTAPDKRDKLVATLLNDNQNYTQHWLSFWNDLLRNDYSGTGFITGGRKQITDWLYHSLLENKPYNQIVKELTNPTEASEGFIKGIEWRGVVNASQRTEMQAAQNISQSLLGVNLKCASCHNSFVSNVTLDQAYGFANIFSDSTLEIYRCDQPTGKMSKVSFLYEELGSVEAETIKEKLKLLSEVMVKPENGRLYRTITNRLWGRLMGRGIVEPVDEMDNTPWNAELLDWLAADFIENDYDLKHLLTRIMTSKTYQLPSANYASLEELKSEKYVFTGPARRRLSAEQFADAVSQVVAPVYYATAYDPEPDAIPGSWIWAREIELERDVLPKPGKRFFRYEFNVPSGKKITAADALITVDHAFTLYVNGKEAAEGSNWRKVKSLKINDLLQTGPNVIAVAGENEGNIPNPAGLLFSLRLTYEDGTQDYVYSNEDWKVANTQPEGNWTSLNFDDIAWEPVKIYKADHWGKLISFTFDQEDELNFARASMVALDPFLKALGRPTRENVATSRDNQATLLQALELTNGVFFDNVLKEGASSWLEQYGQDSQTMANQLYLKSFGRKPNEKEQDLIVEALGPKPGVKEVQDLLWATVLLPEFQFIY
ncbi:DUF1549 domain-containing protein [Catalinimonas niigatensis]|uniref:DUF1549 domain-containing protein n=1 Tax=Catalinimonas niigatensis TaxID=1397264 RepID=UPI0026652D81|nr:DUF1549 domain-containing protein [Catalinimonas niigatensis]WPP50352.1 DUF1553 domain-containing protein [Catalinimonas niigatensis]